MTIGGTFFANPEKIKKDDFSGIKWAKTPTLSHFREKHNFNDPYYNRILCNIGL